MEPGSKSRDKDTPKQWEREHSTVLPDPLSSRAMLLIHQLGILTFFFPHILWIPKIHSHSGFLLKHQNVAFFSISFSRNPLLHRPYRVQQMHIHCYARLELTPTGTFLVLSVHLKHQAQKSTTQTTRNILCDPSRLKHSTSRGSSLLQKCCSLGISATIVNYSGGSFCHQTGIFMQMAEGNK